MTDATITNKSNIYYKHVKSERLVEHPNGEGEVRMTFELRVRKTPI